MATLYGLEKTSKPKKVKYIVEPAKNPDDYIGKTCSICGKGILTGEEIAVCPCCSIPYHFECWEYNGGCGNYGCQAAPEVEKVEVTPVSNANTWASEKKCPQCGAVLPINALNCRVCRAVFPNEEPMTREQWLSREYSETELPRIRMAIIMQFLASTVGFLFIVTIPFNLYTLTGDYEKYEFRRLTPELKFLVYFSTFASIMWVLLIFVFIIIAGIK